MTAKEYLSQIRVLFEKIKHREEQIAELQESVSKAGAIDYSKEKVQSSINRNMDDIVSNYLDKCKMLEKDKLAYIELKDRLIREIESLNNPIFFTLLYKRYVEFKSLEQISVEMCYNYSYIKHAHGWALSYFAKEILTNDDKMI